MAAWVTLDETDATPLYLQVDRAIRGGIHAGRLAAGTQLPTVRALAVDLRVNANTIARVYADLERAGILETRRGVGTFVAAVQPAAGQRRGRDAELRRLVQRWLTEAAARGFTPQDVAKHLREQIDTSGG